jgi:hypothetical protein
MNRSPTIPLLILAVFAVLLAFTLTRGGTRPATQAAPDDLATASEVDAASALTDTFNPQPRGAALPARAVPPTDSRSLFAPERDPEELRAERDQIVRDLEAAHRNQRVDPAWAPRAERQLSEILDDSGIKASTLAPVSFRNECRSNSCRISAEFTSAADAEDWSMMFITSSGGTFQQTRSMLLPLPDGRTEARIYGTRR